MRRLLLLLAATLLCFLQAPAYAQGRAFSQPELEALLAPVALYPDPVLSNILAAATHPDQVSEAARMPGADNPAWDPSVRALVAMPEVLERMAESPQWMFDLCDAALLEGPQISQAVQALRQRAYESGYVRSTDQYVIYYNPLIVYGAWRPAYGVVYWRPWPTRRVFVTERYVRIPESQRRPIVQSTTPIAQRGNGGPSPALQQQQLNSVTPHVRAPEANRQPSVQSATAPIAQRGNGGPSPALQMQPANRHTPAAASEPRREATHEHHRHRG